MKMENDNEDNRMIHEKCKCLAATNPMIRPMRVRDDEDTFNRPKGE